MTFAGRTDWIFDGWIMVVTLDACKAITIA